MRLAVALIIHNYILHSLEVLFAKNHEFSGSFNAVISHKSDNVTIIWEFKDIFQNMC